MFVKEVQFDTFAFYDNKDQKRMVIISRKLGRLTIFACSPQSIAKARQGLKEYFEFYNRRRRHQSLDRRTPDDVYWSTLPQKQVAA